ncbi:MAG: GWxTD domain-containing protein [Ignavibacteriales bacterium]|nr:GWxTD domain-containing protein [Ignavibacteriales bacterium]
MIKRLFIVFFISIPILYPQELERKFNQGIFNTSVLFEKNFIRTDKEVTLFYSYRIPFNFLNFIKEQDKYFSNVSVNVELKDKNGFIYREIGNEKCVVDDYNLTQSREDFLQGVIKFIIPGEEYISHINLIMNNSKNVFIPQVGDLHFEEINDIFYKPIYIYGSKDSSSSFHLTNFGNDIPFIHSDLSLIIPFRNLTEEEVRIEVIQNNEICLSQSLTNKIPFKFNIEKMSDNIYLNNEDGEEIFLCFIENFNRRLYEGYVQIKIFYKDQEQIFNTKVVWYDKPKSLYFPELAIEALAAIESEEVISELMEGSREKYYQNLVDYWKEMKPDDGYAFNEIMKEYYLRVDYAIDNLSSFKLRNGFETDRGMIYIKYGQPDSIERDYTKRNDINEMWTYLELNKKFIFVDKTGTGDYKLMSQ